MNDQLVSVFLDFPKIEGDERIGRLYPEANFSKLISQVRNCEPSYLKMVGVIMIIEALISRVKESGLGVAPNMKDPLAKGKVQDATGEMSRFNDRLKKFRADRNLIVHSFFDRNTDSISDEIMEHSQSLMNDLLEHFIGVRPHPDTPGALALRFPELWTLKTKPPGHGQDSKKKGS